METNIKPLGETSKEIVNVRTVRMIMQVKGKLRDINRSGRDNFDRYLGMTSGGMTRAAN